MVTHIQHPDDDRLSAYRDVGNAEALRARGLFVAEGRLVVERLIDDGRFAVESILVTPAAFEGLRDVLSRSISPVLVAPTAVVKAVTGFNFHRGCLGLARRPDEDEPLASFLSARRLLVLEGIGNSDNVGGLFRVASALGGDGVLLDESSGDPFYRKAIRTSMAATLRVRFARLPLGEALAWLQAAGFQTMALTPSADAVDISSVERRNKVALLLGSEGAGLSKDTLAASDVRARIPIVPAADSLNVAVAAGIALHTLRC